MQVGYAKFFYSFDDGSAVSSVEYKGSVELNLAKILN